MKKTNITCLGYSGQDSQFFCNNGGWSGTVPTCFEDCSQTVDALTNALSDCNEIAHGSKCPVMCASGFTGKNSNIFFSLSTSN